MALENHEAELLQMEVDCEISDRQSLLLIKSGYSVTIYDDLPSSCLDTLFSSRSPYVLEIRKFCY